MKLQWLNLGKTSTTPETGMISGTLGKMDRQPRKPRKTQPRKNVLSGFFDFRCSMFDAALGPPLEKKNSKNKKQPNKTPTAE